MAESKLEQERIQADLKASHERNEELRRVNEELRRGLRNNRGQCEHDEMENHSPPREFSTPFSQEILDAVIPNTFVGPKVIFTGMEDPETHLAAFHTQMVLVGGSDAAKCKLFMVHQPPGRSYHLFLTTITIVQGTIPSKQGPAAGLLRFV